MWVTQKCQHHHRQTATEIPGTMIDVMKPLKFLFLFINLPQWFGFVLDYFKYYYHCNTVYEYKEQGFADVENICPSLKD
jgi:hypothetical protein